MFDKQFDNFLNDKITDFSEIWKWAGKKDITSWKNLDNLSWVKLWLSSADQIRGLSHWKVLISETINYRTQRPERGWLFCEQIFGPRKNYECACGKYKRIRYKWIVCERCGVEVTKASVRRERMGHIDLHAPIAHIWYLKSVPSRIGLFLDLPVKKLEQVVYFASSIITDVYEEKVTESLKSLEETYKVTKIEMQKEIQREVSELKLQKEAGKLSAKKYSEAEFALMNRIDTLTEEFEEMRKLLTSLEVWTVIGELEFRILNEKFPHVFRGGTWAEYIKTLLERVNLIEFIEQNQKELEGATQVKSKKILQKIKLASNLLKSGQRPEWMILEVLPIIPPDLRPMIQLDGGRFASSDLNDLYRRVINRNNRLKKLIELWAPEVILKNEKRMLQEAVDMLITGESRNNRSGYVTANKKKLKSLTEVLKGKQWRFRQNLLGKRVDYSARSVIVVGPELALDHCGLPKKMALILFKPFIIGKLIEEGIVYNVKHAEKYILEWHKEVWDALDEVIEWKYVLLNRAPTLHRLSIQAFKPVLVEWKAIRLHPLTCTAFNADFDWDQMAVHLPLTEKAQAEAQNLMITSKNLLNPSNGEPVVTPSQDMLLWLYYITSVKPGVIGEWRVFASEFDAQHAFEAKTLSPHALVKVRVNWEIIETTLGRIFFNEIVPSELWFINDTIKKWVLKKILADCFENLWPEVTALFVDKIKTFWYKYATFSGLSIAESDMVVPDIKKKLLSEASEKVKLIQKKYWNGFMTEEEKYTQSITVWAEVKKIIETEMKGLYDNNNHIFNMIDSGARWNWWNVTQLAGMKWLVASTTGKTIELPIKSTLKEGFSTLEYFIATHWGRKWKSDTALKTAQSGYLTRRLVDSSQNIIVREDDCGTIQYKTVLRNTPKSGFEEKFEDRIYSHTLARDIEDSKGNTLLKAWEVIDKKALDIINLHNISEIPLRSVLTCETEWGVCQKCYGLDLAANAPVEIGSPIWVIAAQSIGEPGTQLTMRTFHSGWVAKEGGDMTQGLTRVEELFEARTPKALAEIADIDWVVSVEDTDDGKIVSITAHELGEDEYYIWDWYEILVKEWAQVKEKQLLARNKKEKIRITAHYPGVVKKIKDGVIIVKDIDNRVCEYQFELGKTILVKTWDEISVWEKITEWNLSIAKLMYVAWVLAAQKYIVDEIKSIYASQWQAVNSKHIELVVRQMFSRVRILDKWESEFFPWDIVDIIAFKKANDALIKEGKVAAIGERLLLWITKISLYTDSWLSAASFQETVRVLVEGSVSGKVDRLKELKENVIIGRLIPAWEQYRKINWHQPIDGDDYFDPNANDDIDVSPQHVEEVAAEMEHESDF